VRAPFRLWSLVLGILRDPDLAPVAGGLFLHGLAQGVTGPLLALWLARAYHAGASGIAAYFTCVALGSLALNPLLGRLSDRLRRRRPTAALAASCQAAGLAVLAAHPPLAAVLAAGAALLAPQVQPHLFALVDDHVGPGRPDRPRALTVATLRAMISAAWAVGAPLGGIVWGRGGTADLFVLAALLNTAAVGVILGGCREAARGGVGRPGDTASGAAPRWGQLVLFGLAALLAVAGNTVKMQAVPLYLARLGLPSAAVGLTFGWMALAEMILMPPVGRIADRWPRKGVVALGLLGGTVFFAAIALFPGSAAVVVAFPAISLLIVALQGVGIGYAQDLDPRHPGLAGGVFFAAQGLGQAAGGPLIAAAERIWGLPRAFLVPAATILAACGTVLVTRPARAPSPSALSTPAGVRTLAGGGA
jgi:SET family sugar efflux transporter-like MFS transporter